MCAMGSALVVELSPTFTLEQHVHAAVTISNARLCDLAHALTQCRLRILDAAIVVGAASLLDQPARPLRRKTVVIHDVAHCLSLQRGRGHCFVAISCRMALPRLSSTTSFLSRSFSSWSCFSSRTWFEPHRELWRPVGLS